MYRTNSNMIDNLGSSKPLNKQTFGEHIIFPCHLWGFPMGVPLVLIQSS